MEIYLHTLLIIYYISIENSKYFLELYTTYCLFLFVGQNVTKEFFYFENCSFFLFNFRRNCKWYMCRRIWSKYFRNNYVYLCIPTILPIDKYFFSYQVCCIFDISCGGKSSKNLTYFSYSGSTINGAVCTAQICRSSENICQFRLDMDVFVISDADNCMLKIEYLSTSELSL